MKYRDKIRQYAFVINELVSREIKRKYARSYLGIVWSVLNPLLSMAVMSMIFTTIFKKSIENYPVYYLTGTILWGLFSGATSSAMTSLVDNKNLLIKVKLPMAVFPLARCGTALANLGYSLIAYLIILLVFRIQPNVYMPFFFVFILLLFLFSLGVGYFLSVLYVLFGDIKHLYSVLLTLWMFCSAIFYPAESTTKEMYEFIIRNPIYNYITCARKCILYGQLPTLNEWARVIIWSIGAYVIGKWYFDKMKNKILQKI